MIQKLLVLFIHLGPKTKRWFWKTWYNLFAKKSSGHDFHFMNYGYYDKNLNLSLELNDERERYPAQLYHHTATQENITGKKVLEVGSGRGGGASFMNRYLKPKSIVGLDISKDAVNLCKSLHRNTGLSFLVGDAEKIPFENESFDVVVNVESSHCYGNPNLFLSEIKRILKCGGVFLWADFRTTEEMKKMFGSFLKSGLENIREKDITENVISSLEKLSNTRSKQIRENVPSIIQPVFLSYAGIKGTSVYNSFVKQKLIYKSATFRKPN